MTEKEKCQNGLLYNPNYDPELQAEMLKAFKSALTCGLGVVLLSQRAASSPKTCRHSRWLLVHLPKS